MCATHVDIRFHKFVAFLIALATAGHMISHITAWALIRDGWESKYKEWTLVSGTTGSAVSLSGTSAVSPCRLP